MRTLLVPAALLALSACVPEAGPGYFPVQTADAGTEQPPATELGGGRGAGDMNGTWLLVHEQSLCVALPGSTLIDEALAVTLELVRIEQTGGRLSESRDICAINLYPVLGFDSVFPIEAASANNPISVEDSYVTGLDIGASYNSGIEHQLFGLRLDDPLSDPIPETVDDPAVIDNDGDGNPGSTLIAGIDCEMYVVQRSSISYRGEFVTPNQIAGQSSTLYAQRVLDSSQVLCRIPREVTPNDPYSHFQLSRIDGRGGAVNFDDNGDGAVDCDEVLARQASVWNYREPDATLCGGT